MKSRPSRSLGQLVVFSLHRGPSLKLGSSRLFYRQYENDSLAFDVTCTNDYLEQAFSIWVYLSILISLF